MELIMISESKLKVMLTATDMRLYGISGESLDKNDAVSRKAFWNILDEAKLQTGFDPAGCKLFVQMYQSKSGGCELFVTRLGGKNALSREKRQQDGPTHESVLTPPTKQNPLSADAEQSIYVFDSLGELLLGCRRLSAMESPPDARAYADDEKRRYYLVLAADTPVLAEYNGTRCRPREYAYIAEHCRLFCTDAIPRLAPLA